MARLLRIVRVLRIITVVPALKKIVDALFETLPRVGFVALLNVHLYIYMGCYRHISFGTTDPEHWGILVLQCSHLHKLPLRDWAAVMKDIIEVFPGFGFTL